MSIFIIFETMSIVSAPSKFYSVSVSVMSSATVQWSNMYLSFYGTSFEYKTGTIIPGLLCKDERHIFAYSISGFTVPVLEN